MLYNTLIFLAVAYTLAIFATRYAVQLDTVKQLQQSRDALNAIISYYDRKHDQFINLIYPFYEIQDNYDTISRLLESPSDESYESDPYSKQEIVKLLQSVADRDSDIAAIMIQKNSTGAQFLYVNDSRTLEKVKGDFPFFDELVKKNNSGRSIFGTRALDTKAYPLYVHGISGTIGTRNIRSEAGKLLITYKTEIIENIFQSYAGKTLGRFVLASKNGELIFDSDMQYGKGKTFPYMDLLLSGEETAKIDGKSFYIQTIPSLNRNYIGANLVPKEAVSKKNDGLSYLIYGAITAMALICSLLYSITGSLVSKRVRELVTAMKRIGSNNLNYRIPVRVREDEFGELAARFNMMCDDLQETIDREYLSEIRKKNAELHALQAGINPHFLYNTLEAIRVKALDDGSSDVSEMIVLLASLYRSIVRDNTFIPILKEISLCEMYTDIFSLRYASSFEYSIEADPELLEFGIPKNLLQPIIENYFVHGLNGHAEYNRFVIRGFMRGGDIHFVFEDNGRGMAASRLEAIQTQLYGRKADPKTQSYGLFNVHERIRLVYGEAYGITVKSEENRYTRIDVRIRALTCKDLQTNIYGVN